MILRVKSSGISGILKLIRVELLVVAVMYFMKSRLQMGCCKPKIIHNLKVDSYVLISGSVRSSSPGDISSNTERTVLTEQGSVCAVANTTWLWIETSGEVGTQLRKIIEQDFWLKKMIPTMGSFFHLFDYDWFES